MPIRKAPAMYAKMESDSKEESAYTTIAGMTSMFLRPNENNIPHTINIAMNMNY